jgi:hypothetical protein
MSDSPTTSLRRWPTFLLRGPIRGQAPDPGHANVLIAYTEGPAACRARLIAHARRAGKQCGAHELIIAAHALQTDRVILTFDANARFGDLPGVSATSP